jgi:DNA-binding NtrC family response regulator
MSDDIGILIVDDEQIVRESLASWFQEDGYRVGTASDGRAALGKMQDQTWHIALLDIKMPGMDGLELQQKIREIDENIIVIIMTAYASVDTAVQALKDGAYDYITKPFDPDDLAHIIRNAIERRRLVWENAQMKERIEDLEGFDDIVGKSEPLTEALGKVAQVAQTDATVLVLGESGTGKELIAQAIHQQSRRRYMPIVTVNCGAMTEGLLESELFGHEKGAFTGAQYRKKGKVEVADGGTLFLDEVGDISPKTQADLLRVLETKEFTRVGGTKPIRSDFRVVSATNRNLQQLISDGAFRTDLYYRLNAFTIRIPPLRARQGDTALLAEHFRGKLSQDLHKQVTSIAPDAMDMLEQHTWPGNVRELRHVIEHAIVVAQGPVLTATDIELSDLDETNLENIERPAPARDPTLALTDIERDHIVEVLKRTDWNVTQAAKILDIDRGTLYNKIRRYDLERPEQ